MILPRFYPILDTAALARIGGDVLRAAADILDAGAKILQFRHKGTWTESTFEQARTICQQCRAAEVLYVINDRADIALLLHAAVHVGQDDLRPADVRALIGASLSLGFSTHNEPQLRAAAEEPVDYIALGPMFGTRSKANPDPIVGAEELQRLRPLSPKPVVAIGGVTLGTAESLWSAGADSVAVIGDLFVEPDRIGARAKRWVQLANG